MTRRLHLLAALLSGLTVVAQAAGTDIVSEVIQRFYPLNPSVVVSYDATYALLHIRLKRVASATLEATEGVWHSSPSNTWVPACLIDFDVTSPRSGENSGENHVCLFKRTVSVLTLPDLKIVTYVKHNDEFIKPFFMEGRHMNYVEVYDFESGTLKYRHHDLISGAVETNLPGMADLARQSMEVADVLQTLLAAYRGQAVTGRPVANEVHFNVDGAVRTFALKTQTGRTSVPFLSRKIEALYADVQPVADSDGPDESFSMWCMPFRDFSRETRDPELKKLGATSLECSMLPLSGEYGLFLGAIECTLTCIRTQPRGN